jgi:HEAT repeat protein
MDPGVLAASIAGLGGSFLRDIALGVAANAAWKHLDSSTLKAVWRQTQRGLEQLYKDGHLTEEDWRVLLQLGEPPLDINRLIEEIRQRSDPKITEDRAQQLAELLLIYLRGAVANHYAKDPLTQFHPVQGLLTALRQELTSQGQGLATLVKASEAYDQTVWQTIRAQLNQLCQAANQPLPAVRLWRRLEDTLRQSSERDAEPRPYRPMGPSWWDFARGAVFRRDEVDTILGWMTDPASPTRIYALSGDSAAGKSVLAHHVGFEWLTFAPVFTLNAGDDINPHSPSADQLAESLNWLARQFTASADPPPPSLGAPAPLPAEVAAVGPLTSPGTAGAPPAAVAAVEPSPPVAQASLPAAFRPLFIIDDLHRNWDFSRTLIQCLGPCPEAHVLLVTRPYHEPEALREAGLTQDPLQALRHHLKLAADDFEQTAPRIAAHLWRLKTGEDLPEGRAAKLARTAEHSLWLLAWLVEGYQPDGEIDRSVAYQQARAHLADLTRRYPLEEDWRPQDLLLTIAVFSQFEAPIDRAFVESEFPGLPHLRQTLRDLCTYGELHETAALDTPEGPIPTYRLPHSAVAGVYLGATGPTAATHEVLIRAFVCEDQAGQARFERLRGHSHCWNQVYQLCMGTMRKTAMRDAIVARVIHTCKYADTPRTREQAMCALCDLGDPRAVEVLLGLLQDADVRRKAILLVGHYNDPRAVEPLLGALQDADELVRSMAAWALGGLGDHRAVEPLMAALQSSHQEVRSTAAVALGRLNDLRAVEPLIGALEDPDQEVRSSTAWALGQLNDARAVEPLISALWDPGGRFALAVHRALTCIDDPCAVEPLTAALQHPHRLVRNIALARLSNIGDARAIEALERLIEHGDRCDREEAHLALARIRAHLASQD